MDSKPTVEQFMSHFFQERTASLKRLLEIHFVYWRRFYHEECLHDSRRGTLERSEAEKIISISPSVGETEVVTTGHTVGRSRYHVKSSSAGWLIHEVDIEYSFSENEKRWVSPKERAASMRQFSDRPVNPALGEEPGLGRLGDSAIEQFMIGHFRERTATWKREGEIHAEYAKRFYSPEYDSKRLIPSDEWSKAETIEKILRIETGAHVITSGLHNFRLRYELRPSGRSRLIWSVDRECPFCWQTGRKPDCIWCGGTIWERRRSPGGPPHGGLPGENIPPESPRW